MENTQKINNLIIIRIDEMIHWVKKRIIWILLAGVLLAGAGAGFALTRTSVPMYMTTTKLYFSGVQSAVPSASNFSLGRQIISNYIQLMESRPVLEEVIESLNLNMSTKQLASCISQYVPGETCILEVTVVFPDAEWAKTVADEVVVVSADYVLQVMGGTPPIVYEEATVPTAPYNNTDAPVLQYAVLGGLAGIILAGMVVVATYFINTKFNTPGKVTDKLGYQVWGVVPKEAKFRQTAGEAFVSRLSYEAGDDKVISFIKATAKENTYEVMKKTAEILSGIDKKAVCVDTNLGNPEWSAIAQEYPDNKGLHGYLTKAATLNDVIIKGEDGLDKIVCGSKAINAGELFKSEAFSELIEQLKADYDYIFMDTAPIKYAMESFAVARMADLTLWSVSAKKTKTYQAKDVKKQLTAQNIEVAGVVLTDLVIKKGGKFFAKKYGKYVGLYKK